MRRLQRFRPIYHLLLCLLIGVNLSLMVGCPTSSSSISSIIGSQLGGVLAEEFEDFEELLSWADPSQIVTIRIINKSGLTEEVDILVDGESKLIICDADQSVCDWVLASCPSRIEAVQERRLDAARQLRGARNFDGAEEFVFTAEEFSCGSFIIFEFSATEAKAYVE